MAPVGDYGMEAQHSGDLAGSEVHAAVRSVGVFKPGHGDTPKSGDDVGSPIRSPVRRLNGPRPVTVAGGERPRQLSGYLREAMGLAGKLPARPRSQSVPVEGEQLLPARPSTVAGLRIREFEKPNTTCATPAWTANMYRKRQPLYVETKIFTRYTYCSDFPSRPLTADNGSRANHYDDGPREIPVHQRPAKRPGRALSVDSGTASTAKRPPSRQTSQSPQRRQSSSPQRSGSKGSPQRSPQRSPTRMMRGSKGQPSFDLDGESFGSLSPSKMKFPIGDLVWMTAMLGDPPQFQHT